MSVLYGPFAPTTGKLIPIAVDQSAVKVEIQNASPYAMWATFSASQPPTTTTTGRFYGNIVRPNASKILNVPTDPIVGFTGTLWLLPYNAYAPTTQGTTGAAAVYAVAYFEGEETEPDSGIASGNVGYVPAAGVQAYAPLLATDYNTDTGGNPYAVLSTLPGSLTTPIAANNTWVNATTTINVTLAGAANQLTHLAGLIVAPGNTSSATVLLVSLSGLNGPTNLYVEPGTGNTVAVPWYSLVPPWPIPATGPNTSIVVTITNAGGGAMNGGGTFAAWGFRRAV